LARRPLARVQTPSYRFNSGAHAGNCSRCRRGKSAQRARTSGPLWILPRSQSTMTGPRRWRGTPAEKTHLRRVEVRGVQLEVDARRWRRRLTARPEMAEMLSRRCRWRTSVVWRTEAQVRRTLGKSKNPDLSTQTRWAPSRESFYPGPLRPLLQSDGGLVALERPPLKRLRCPVQGMYVPPDVVRVVPDAELARDDHRSARRLPQDHLLSSQN